MWKKGLSRNFCQDGITPLVPINGTVLWLRRKTHDQGLGSVSFKETKQFWSYRTGITLETTPGTVLILGSGSWNVLVLYTPILVRHSVTLNCLHPDEDKDEERKTSLDKKGNSCLVIYPPTTHLTRNWITYTCFLFLGRNLSQRRLNHEVKTEIFLWSYKNLLLITSHTIYYIGHLECQYPVECVETWYFTQRTSLR